MYVEFTFRLIGLLKRLLRIYGKHQLLVSSMNQHISDLASDFMKNYDSQLDNNFVAVEVLMDMSKTFEFVPHDF